MTISDRRWNWKLGLASWLVIGGAIASWENCATAQIVPDTTLGSENSTVTSTGTVDAINGGATRGTNLFHSFQEFNIGEGRAAIFTNPSGIENILTRVTGANPSNILGTLGVAGGSANLFLINPKGIIFGPNARLDVGGSFVGTTANAIRFGDRGVFSASNPETASSLLMVNPSALLFNQIRAASIENNSVADSGLNPSSEFTATGLRVPDGKSLLLVGGDISMDGGGLSAFGGRVDLGGLAGAGTVGLNGDGNNLSLSFPDGVERSDVSLSNGAGVRVTADDGGSIAVNARNLEMTGRSFLFAGIERGLGSDNSEAGNIEVNATGVISLNNRSFIGNQVLAEARGQGGDISISARALRVEGGAEVNASTVGEGKGGSLTVDTQDVQLIGESADGQAASGLFAQANSTGDAGDLTIKANTLLVRDGALVSASTFAEGKGGNLTVDTQDMQLIGTSNDGQFPSILGASADVNSTGDAGDLTIKTNTLLVRDGAQVNASTFAEGKGGNLTVDAQDMQLIGTSNDGRFPSVLSASALLSNSTGDAGDLTIKTNTLLVKDGAQVNVNTFGEGKGGNLTVDAQDMQLIGASNDGQFPSALSAAAQRNSTGDAGDLTIKTNTLLVKDGAVVNANTFTFAEGKGGNLTIDAQDIQLIGTSNDGGSSGLFVSADPNSTGDAGDLTIKTNTLLVKDGAQVSAATFAEGKGGNLTVDAQDVQVIGTNKDGRVSSVLGVSTLPNSTGDAGDLTIKTSTLLVQDGAFVTVQSRGTGTAGNMTLNARSIRLNNDALLSASTQSARVDPNREQATININSQDLIMRRNSNITTNATGENVIGGNINIDTDFLISFENSDISANSANFRGGNVRINASGIFGTQFRDRVDDRTSDITATGANPEFSGTVELNIPEIDPNSGLVNLPAVPVNTQVAQTCTPGGSQANSEFVVTGRGGLPQNPGEALNTDAVQVDLITLNPQVAQPSTTAVSTSTTNLTPTPIVEAQGWAIDANNNVVLTTNAPTVTPHNSWQNTANCKS